MLLDFYPHPTNIDLVRVIIPCSECKAQHYFDMPEEEFFIGLFRRLRKNLPIQQCFPNLAPEHRETLVSRICPSCFDSICQG